MAVKITAYAEKPEIFTQIAFFRTPPLVERPRQYEQLIHKTIFINEGFAEDKALPAILRPGPRAARLPATRRSVL